MARTQGKPDTAPLLQPVPAPAARTAADGTPEPSGAMAATVPPAATVLQRFGELPPPDPSAMIRYSFRRAPARPPAGQAGPASPASPGAGDGTADIRVLSTAAGAAAQPARTPPAAAPAAPSPRIPQPATDRPPGPAGPPIAGRAGIRPRHRGILASFLALVLLPVIASAAYLWLIAEDQYASTVAFSVRTQEISSSLDLLGGITRLSGGGSPDSDILYDYIHSQELVQDLDAEIDLRRLYAAAWPRDPVFAFDPEGSIEDLVDHWKRKVRISYDSASGLITLRVLAFDPDQATLIATRILERSTDKINALSAEAREDATRYAREEMERALDRLKAAREAMTEFRMRTRMVDPVADLQGQMGILNSLQAQLAESYVQLDLLRGSTSPGDPRIQQVEQRITVIQRRMEEERRKFSEGGQGPGGEDYASAVAEFERLSVDREFAEQAYRVALAAYDAALAEAQRKSRYLAAHIRPTHAETSKYPRRWTLLALTGFFALIAWAIGVLIYYSLRDRR
jgi:capsular polysaccharide transport system permease protein